MGFPLGVKKRHPLGYRADKDEKLATFYHPIAIVQWAKTEHDETLRSALQCYLSFLMHFTKQQVKRQAKRNTDQACTQYRFPCLSKAYFLTVVENIPK
jgi:hypothetical protein